MLRERLQKTLLRKRSFNGPMFRPNQLVASQYNLFKFVKWRDHESCKVITRKCEFIK